MIMLGGIDLLVVVSVFFLILGLVMLVVQLLHLDMALEVGCIE